jgi:hypothetical protein
MSERNGVKAKALALGPQWPPDDKALLLAARAEVLLALATTDVERSLVTETLARGWEERPVVSQLVGMLARRVVSEDDREILRRADVFRILLPEAPAEPAPDPVLEQLIVEQAARKAQVEAIATTSRDALVAAYVALRKAKTPGDVAKLREKEVTAVEAWKHAVAALEFEVGRLSNLLQQRADRRRALALAASVSQQ